MKVIAKSSHEPTVTEAEPRSIQDPGYPWPFGMVAKTKRQSMYDVYLDTISSQPLHRFSRCLRLATTLNEAIANASC